MVETLRRRICLATFVLTAWLTATDCAAVTFTNVTASAGIAYSLPQPLPNLTDDAISMTGGAAAGDFDNDGWPDLFVTRYWNTPLLYRNNHDGTFADVTASAFPTGIIADKSNGASWADVNNDGHLDLYVTSVFNNGANRLYINDGAGHFSDQSVARGVNLGGVPLAFMSASFGDYDNDGYLDMYVGEWRPVSNGNLTEQPRTRLLHNRGAAQPGYFLDVTAVSGTAMTPLTGSPPYYSHSFTPRFADFDRDGRPDLVVASDFNTTKLFWNKGDGTFSDGSTAIASSRGASDMGLAIGDYDGNGLLDWFTTDICASNGSGGCGTPSGDRLFLNYGNRVFLESSSFAGVRDAGWGWGTEMFDYDNDRDLDLVATNGYYTYDPAYETDQMRLWRNNGQGPLLTTFTNVASSTGMTDTSQGRGLLKFDYDRDGDLDLFIVNNFQAPVLYRNDGGNENDWLQIETVGTISNTEGVGAFITVTPDLTQPNKKLVHEISRSSSFLSQSEPLAHFGLGTDADLIDLIRIEWPASGIVQELRNVAPNQLLSIVERLPCDFNGDGQVDAADFTVWRDSFGKAVPHGSSADSNGDGVVDNADYSLWQLHFGETLGGGSGAPSSEGSRAVPEPEAAAAALVGLLLGLARRQRGSSTTVANGKGHPPSCSGVRFR